MAAVQGKTLFNQRGAVTLTWTGVTESDTFTASQIGSMYPDKTVTVTGTFGGATVLIKGSNDGSTYFTCHGQSGSLSFTADGGDVIIENFPYLQATHSGGTSETVKVIVNGTSYV